MQRVVRRHKPGLRIVLIAQIAHAQTGCVRQIQSVPGQSLQMMLTPVQNTRAAPATHQTSTSATSCTDENCESVRYNFPIESASRSQAHHLLQHAPQVLCQRKVVMNAGDALHIFTVAQRQSAPVHMLIMPMCDVPYHAIGITSSSGKSTGINLQLPRTFVAKL